MNKIKIVLPASFLVLATLVHTNSIANGYEFLHQSAEGLGSAYATNGTAINDISAMFSNPASIIRFDGIRASGNFTLDLPRSEMDSASATGPYSSGAVIVEGSPSKPKQFIDTAFGAAGYMTYEYEEDLIVGFAINAPFAYVSDYVDTAVTRYTATKTGLQAINFSPTFAYRINQKWAIGGSLNIQDYEATLGTQVATSVDDPNVNTDISSLIEGSDIGYGFSIGFEFQQSDRTRYGASFRSKIDHHFKGTVKLSGTDANLASGSTSLPSLTNYNGVAKFDISTPFMLQLGLLHKLNETYELYANANLSGWSAFKDTHITYDNGLPETVVDNDWSDSWYLAVGMGYQYSEKVKLRTGMAYDWTPTPSAAVSPRAPNNDRYNIGLGASYQYSPATKIDFGYQYIKFTEVTIALAGGNNVPRGTLNGKINLYANVFMLQMNHQFNL
ncbi:MAG: long-chain fatty acid transport protein [Gammaproteobacteria bacterium]|jgi:long-chain fatty acid transport protein